MYLNNVYLPSVRVGMLVEWSLFPAFTARDLLSRSILNKFVNLLKMINKNTLFSSFYTILQEFSVYFFIFIVKLAS